MNPTSLSSDESHGHHRCKRVLSVSFQSTLFILVIILLTMSSSKCESDSLDDEIYERQNESTYLASTLVEKLVKFYNLTENFQEKFNRMARYDPFGEGSKQVDVLIVHVQDLTKEYQDVATRLKDPSTRSEAKKEFDQLYHKSTDHSEELKITLDMANLNPGGYLQTNPVLDKALEDYESLKRDLEAVNSKLLNEFVDSAIILAEKEMFPESVLPPIPESARLEDVEYADLLMELHRLYKTCYELELKALAANDEDLVEAFMLGKNTKVHQLFDEVIPAYVAKNKVALSHIVPVTIEKIHSMEEKFREVDMKKAVENEQGKIIQRVFDAWSEDSKLSDARTAAGEVYHKYFERLTHEEREASRKRDEL